jgi:ribosomal protein L37E
MLTVLRNNDKGKVFEYEELTFLKVNSTQFNLQDFSVYIDAIYIDTGSLDTIQTVLQKIRSNPDNLLFLLPVFAPKSVTNNNHELGLDGKVDNSDFFMAAQRTRSIQERISHIKIDTQTEDIFENQIQIKAIQFAYTRNMPLTPLRNRESKTGYIYPFIDNISSRKQGGLINQLDSAVNKGWMLQELQDKINVCPSCNDTYLHFRDTCSSCGSIDLKYEEIIHHFKCAHVAPKSSFLMNDRLQCPKCDNHLRHIGIDYDKPSEITICNTCSHQSQETHMKAHCVSCGTESDVHEIETRSIYKYSITSLGIQVAIHGNMGTEQEEDNNSTNLVGWQLFQLYKNQETQRSMMLDNNNRFIHVHIQSDMISKLNSNAKDKFRVEMAQIIASYLRPEDIISAENVFNYELILIQPTDYFADDLMQTLQYNIEKMLGDNLQNDKTSVDISWDYLKNLNKQQTG